jgi:4-amino-4-deoxy-L-arabinose transferase-like glycosyltransferase
MSTGIHSASQQNVPVAPAPSGRTGAAGSLWESIGLFTIILFALALRLYGLERNGWGAEYYTAAVRSMAINWHNFFFCAFDPTGFISVDKPPVALWLQVAAVKLFGFHPLSILLPQVLEGVASVWVLFHLVRRHFSAAAALLAAVFLAITPVFVAVNRTNNTDSCLVLVLLLAAWALMKAAEEGNRWLLLLSMSLIGLAFNTKMLAAFIVLPTFVLIYFVGAPRKWQRRFVDLTLAAVVLTATSLPWVLTYELTPADSRPFIGGSTKNSMLELLVGYNGIGRFVSRIKQTEITGNRPETARTDSEDMQRVDDASVPVEPRPRNILARLFVNTPTGPLRLTAGQLAAQTGWLLPLAIMALLIGFFQSPFRRPFSPANLFLLFWFCWIVTYVVVYSSAGGIMHFYYLSTMAPALAALAGIGLASLWDYYRREGLSKLLLPATLLITAVWELYIQASALGWTFVVQVDRSGNLLGWLHVVLIAGTIIAVLGLLLISLKHASNRVGHALAAGALATGIIALLAVPAAWTLSSVLLPGQGVLPSADLYRLVSVSRTDAYIRGRLGRTVNTSKLVSFLTANHNGERYLLATSTAQLAAPIIINTGEAVLARGGFHGLDPAVPPEKLARMVEAKQVRFVMLGDVAGVSRKMGADAAGKPTADWVRANGKLVDPILWRSSRRRSSMELYDLRPDITLNRPALFYTH